MGLNILHGMCNNCIHRHVFVRQWIRKIHGKQRSGLIPEQTRPLKTTNYSTPGPKTTTPGPPWRVLFFGTDDFAVQSLKLLSMHRGSSDRVVESLEVVTLSNDVPVKRFAEENRLPVRSWPLGDLKGRFDVGVVVSFGCLIRERVINQFPCGVLNVHPSLLPRWRGPAPVFHTILHGDALTGVTVMQIRPDRFDVGPILHQELYQVPENCTADQLGATLAAKGADLLIDTLKTLPERIMNRREQDKEGATLAPKITTSLSWLVWEEQTCEQIGRLYRAIGSRIPLRTIWMGRTIKLMDFVGSCNISLSGRELDAVPGSISYQKHLNTLAVCCKDGWVGFRVVVLKKKLSATDFYNGYLHQSLQEGYLHQSLQEGTHQTEGLFLSNKDRTEPQPTRDDWATHQQHTVH